MPTTLLPTPPPTQPDSVVKTNPLPGLSQNTDSPYVTGKNQPSTTTASNASIISQVPKIQQTTQNLSKTGISYDSAGNQVYANGTLVNPSPSGNSFGYDANGNPLSNPNSNLSNNGANSNGINQANTYTDAMGQTHLVGDGTPPAGSTPDGNGNYIGPDGKQYAAPVGDTSHYDKQIFDSIDSLKAQVSANLATQLDTIKSQYNSLISQQQQINKGATGKLQNALLMGGVTGQGSTSQYASTSADQQVTSSLNYGLQKIADLNTQEQQAIAAANSAALSENIQLQDQANTQINKARDAAQAIATKISTDLQAAQTQASKDKAVTQLYTSGTTNPSDILSALQKQGRNDITLKDITDSINSVIPPGVLDMVKTMETNGAPATMISKVLSSSDMATAIKNAGDYLKNATGTMGDYLAYKRDAESNGLMPESFDKWQNEQDAKTLKNENSKAYGSAFNTAAGKAAAEAKYSANAPTSPVTDANGNTWNAPASVAPYARTSTNGVRYVDLSDFAGTPTEKNQAVQDAQNAGLRIITNKNSANDVQNITDAMSKLADMKAAFDKSNSGNVIERNAYGAALTWAGKALQANPDAVGTDVYQDTALDVLKAMSGVQGFRGGASMIENVKNTFPKNTDTQAVIDAKISNIEKLIGDRETALVGKPSASDQLLLDGSKAKSTINSFYPTAGKSTQGIIDKLFNSNYTDSDVLDYLKQNNLIK